MSRDLWIDSVKTRRPRARQWVWRATLALACLLIAARSGRAAEPDSGLVVESVAPVSAGALSGFQPGDVLLSWSFRPRDKIEDRSDATQAREEARKILESETPDSLPLLAEIDRSLGLLLEAREELRQALDRKPGDPGLRLDAIERRLKDENDRE